MTKRGEVRIFCLLFFALCVGAKGQQADSLKQIQTISVGSLGSAEGADELRRELIDVFKHSDEFRVVDPPQLADASIEGRGELWIRGYHSLSPRARANPATAEPLYTGYLSVKVRGRNGEILWSYLANPARVSLSDVKHQLAGQIVSKLADDIEHDQPAPAITPTKDVAEAPVTPVTLEGAGATFPFPIYQDWFQSFHARHPAWKFDYQPIGSEAGLGKLTAGTIDFAGSDIPPAATIKDMPGTHAFPSVGGAVVLIYNLHHLADNIQFSADVLVGIFTGRIKRWNDPAIRALNRHIPLPDAEIVLVHRGEGSGTTYALTDFLSKADAGWRQAMGAAPRVNWPAGAAASGNEGVAKFVTETPNSLGYVEFVYAFYHHLSFASVRGPGGSFITPGLASISAAANGVSGDDSLGGSIANSKAPGAYPIATFSWLIFNQSLNQAKRLAMTRFLEWMLTSGQKECSALGYAPLSPVLLDRERSELKKLR